MEFIKEQKIKIFIFLLFILLICALVAWGKLLGDDEEVNINSDNDYVDLSDVNNVSSVEARLDYKMKITQGYLLTYTTNKSGIWYMSSAVVNKIKIDGTEAYVTLTNKEKTHMIIAKIESNKVNIKTGDSINFVGTIDLETGNIELAKISKDTINYNNVTELEFSKLVDNIKLVKDNIFVIDGYMITDKDRYKLFESKTDYEEDSNVGTYFTIGWKDKFEFTGNANVTLECKINGTYKLKDCVLVD